MPPKLALQKGRPLSRARFSRRSSAIQPLRLSSLSCPKTLGAVFCAGLRHPVSARLSQAVCLGPPLCGSLPSLLGSGRPSFLPQSSSCGCLWRLPISWRTMVPRGAPQSPQARVGLLSKSGGLSLTCLGVWCCLWGAVLFLGDLGVLGLQHLISSLRVLFGRVLFWGVGFLVVWVRCICGLQIDFFEWVMITCLCVHAFLGVCLCLLVLGCGHWNCVFMNSFSSTVDVCSIV